MTGSKDSSPKGFVEGAVPNDGDIMRYNEAKGGWEPYPFTEAATELVTEGGGGGGGVSPSDTQINLPFVDISADDGTAARAGAQNVKAVLVKVGNLVTMCINNFSLTNNAGQVEALQTDYDFIEVEFVVPEAYRPVKTLIQPIFRIFDNEGPKDAYLIVGAEGYVQIYEKSTGVFVGGPVHTNGYTITASWIVGPAFV